MTLEPIQQIINQIQNKKHILITTKANPSADAVCSCLSLYSLAKKMGKKADIIIDDKRFKANQNYSFLADHSSIQNQIKPSRDMIMEFDIGDTNIQGLTYKVKNNKLQIRVFADKKDININAPKLKQQSYDYDLIAVLDTCDLDSLGSVYNEHTEFFYHTPIINIDHESENEHFGELNLVEFTATSTTEILFTLAEVLDKNLIDENISTCMLCGIIHESKSFQIDSITPRTLAIASELMTLGADRQKIIQNLFYNQAVNTLQLWGRALANIKTDETASVTWSSVSENDFKETQTTEQDLLAIVDDLLMHAPESKIVVLLYKQDDKFNAIIHTHEPQLDLRRVFSRLGAHGSRNLVECEIYEKKEDTVIQNIKQILSAQ